MMDDETPQFNDLAYDLASKCRVWAKQAYTCPENDTSDIPKNPALEKQYETRLGRAIAEAQTKLQTQTRALDEVYTLQEAGDIDVVTRTGSGGRQ
jgi:hypothetical protein